MEHHNIVSSIMIGKNNKMIKFRVRQMTINDINTVLGIWAKNNLHEGTQTIQSFMIQDPEGFIVAEQIFDDDDDQDEKPKNDETMTNNGESGQNSAPVIGMCVGIFVHPTIAFIGLYGVQPELHGHGIGIAMWKRMMDHIGSLNAGLYAVPEHLTMYRDRAGFQNPDDLQLITAEWYNKVIDYDAHVHGYIRAKLLPHVLNEEGSAAFVASNMTGEKIFGYGCIRTNNIGKAMIGPLYADNDAIAELLMHYLFARLSTQFAKGLLYMTLDSNPGGERIAEKLALKQQEKIQRFFRSQPYDGADWDRVYCIHSPNFSLL
ncbi:holothin acyltransferase-like isoform X2 [Dermatophagoides pteronyssinus]|uniref:holothin acyltransferase-like isoform X2 n=1 Tax=Dermatophagoides pteronyssinus TaxID=6956 RepID=UPI003F66130D